MFNIFLIAIAVFAAAFLYKRYYPVRSVPCIQNWRGIQKENAVILDIRDYNESSHDPIAHALNIPYAYLPRFYKDIPAKPVHVVASQKLDRNLGIRFLTKKGFEVKSYSLTECPCGVDKEVFPYGV
ncbi:MAG: rhodanese-like domain-containing protein [Ectobacillus sp.]